MPGRYFSQRDRDLFESMNKELVGDVQKGNDGIIHQTCEIFKISVYDTETNMYGESNAGKQYNPGVQIAALIAHEDFDWTTNEFGPDMGQNATFAFIRQELIDAGIRPELGDLIGWNYSHFEINDINENNLIGGIFGNNWDVACTGFLTRISSTNIEEIRNV